MRDEILNVRWLVRSIGGDGDGLPAAGPQEQYVWPGAPDTYSVCWYQGGGRAKVEAGDGGAGRRRLVKTGSGDDGADDEVGDGGDGDVEGERGGDDTRGTAARTSSRRSVEGGERGTGGRQALRISTARFPASLVRTSSRTSAPPPPPRNTAEPREGGGRPKGLRASDRGDGGGLEGNGRADKRGIGQGDKGGDGLNGENASTGEERFGNLVTCEKDTRRDGDVPGQRR